MPWLGLQSSVWQYDRVVACRAALTIATVEPEVYGGSCLVECGGDRDQSVEFEVTENYRSSDCSAQAHGSHIANENLCREPIEVEESDPASN